MYNTKVFMIFSIFPIVIYNILQKKKTIETSQIYSKNNLFLE